MFVMMIIMSSYGWNGMMLHDVMRCCMNEYTYVVEQYEFSNSRKVRRVLLPRGLCLVRVIGFRSFVSL